MIFGKVVLCLSIVETCCIITPRVIDVKAFMGKPSRSDMVSSCLSHIASNHFERRWINRTTLVTIFLNDNVTSPIQDIQDAFMQKTPTLSDWFTYQLVSERHLEDFQSYESEGGKRHFVPLFKTYSNIVFADVYQEFERVIQSFESRRNFLARGYQLVYLEVEGEDYLVHVERVLRLFYEHSILHNGVLVAHNSTVMNFYKLDLVTRYPDECLSNFSVQLFDQCVNGMMQHINKKFFTKGLGDDLLGCRLNVLARAYPPFVINEKEGVEIKVLNDIGKKINVTLDITLGNISLDWGEKSENGTWTGYFRQVYEDRYIGIGNIDAGLDPNGNNFHFSNYYLVERLVFVVPLAKLVPAWRTITAIFSIQMWGVCLLTIVLFGLLFRLTARKRDENYKRYYFLTSLMVFISYSAPQQPVSDVTRVFFVSLGVFSVIISSVYTCSLVYYLKNPMREVQPTVLSDIRDEFGNFKYYLGGIDRFKTLFNTSENIALFNYYQTKENDSITYWLEKVGTDRDTWTISSNFYVQYLLSINDEIVVDEAGRNKIYVFQNKLMSYSICMAVRKGHPLTDKLDKYIKYLLYGGLPYHYAERYLGNISKSYEDDRSGDNTLEPLTMKHMQGPFAMLGFGCVFGLVGLLVEVLKYKYEVARKRKKELAAKVVKKMKRNVKKGKRLK